MEISIPQKYKRTNPINTWYKNDKFCPYFLLELPLHLQTLV